MDPVLLPGVRQTQLVMAVSVVLRSKGSTCSPGDWEEVRRQVLWMANAAWLLSLK